MPEKRTDLAAESRELYRAARGNEPEGIDAEEYVIDGVEVTKIVIQNEAGAASIGKPVGTYITASLQSGWLQSPDWITKAASILSRLLRPLLPESGTIMVCGLGNPGITPDNLGPETVDNVVVTRHLMEKMPGALEGMRSVCAISTGVLGVTGIETAEIIRGVSDRVRPAAIIAIDALAAHSPKRLCRTFQMSNTGIVPGSGAYNSRNVLNEEVLGVPVIAIGVPTVIESSALIYDTLENRGLTPRSGDFPLHESMLVTPKDIDALIAKSAKVIGYAINIALQGAMTVAEMEQFLP